MNIYDIKNEYQLIIADIINNDGEITPDQETALQINRADLETKGINYAYVIKQLDADCEAIDLEVKRLNALKKVRSNAVERLKANITSAMLLFEVEEIKTPLIKLNFRKSESVIVMDVNDLPKEYKIVKVTEQADKVKIKEALKAGESILGCELVVNQNIQIK